MNLNGEKALVTGGAARIGRELCLALAGAGYDVAVHYNKSRRAAEELAAHIRRLGRNSKAFHADLTCAADCRRLIIAARRELGGLDALVNNAAVFEKHDLRGADDRALRRMLEINLAAPLRLMRLFAAARPSRGWIVNLLDQRIAGHRRDAVPYLLSKKALAELTAMAALELAPDIIVNAIAPGPALAPARGKAREPAGIIPLRRRPTASDIAGALIFLLKTDIITGQIVYVDGGQHLLGAAGGAM